jgi:hypothetical protein
MRSWVNRRPRTLALSLRCRSGEQAYQALYRGERAAQQEYDPNEAFAAILSQSDLTNPQQDRPQAEH